MIIMSRKDNTPIQTSRKLDPEMHMNGKYILDFPDCIEIGAELGKYDPFNLTFLINDIKAKFFEAYPTYDFLIYEPLLDYDPTRFDKTEMFPTSTGQKYSRFQVGNVPNVVKLPRPNSDSRSGIAITSEIDITALTDDNLGRETFFPYFRVVKKTVAHDETPVDLSGYTSNNQAPSITYQSASESDYSVYISENNGNTYEKMTRLTPFSFNQRTDSIRLAFVNDSSDDLYILSYALMF